MKCLFSPKQSLPHDFKNTRAFHAGLNAQPQHWGTHTCLACSPSGQRLETSTANTGDIEQASHCSLNYHDTYSHGSLSR